MQELRVFIEADSTVRGEKLSAWFELPINEYEFMGKLGVEIDSNDYRITEKELPFADDVGEDTTVDRLNELYQMFHDLPSDIQAEYAQFQCHFSNLDELYEQRNDILHYNGCFTMLDVARLILEENPAFRALSEDCVRYFDLEAYGQHLYDNGKFLETEHGIYELP